MTDSAVIQASYHEFKMVKTRSALQLILEVPIERAEHVFQVLGFPQPGQEQPVAIALLKQNTASKPKDDAPGHISPDDKQWVQRAVLLCQNKGFWRWLVEERNATPPPGREIDEELVANWLRRICSINSRAELATDLVARDIFQRIEQEYYDWARNGPDTTRQAMKDLQRLGQEADAEQEQVRDSVAICSPNGTPAAEPQGADKAQQAISVPDAVKLALDQCHTPEELRDTAQRNQGAVESVCTAEEKKQLTAHYRARLAEMRSEG